MNTANFELQMAFLHVREKYSFIINTICLTFAPLSPLLSPYCFLSQALLPLPLIPLYLFLSLSSSPSSLSSSFSLSFPMYSSNNRKPMLSISQYAKALPGKSLTRATA